MQWCELKSCHHSVDPGLFRYINKTGLFKNIKSFIIIIIIIIITIIIIIIIIIVLQLLLLLLFYDKNGIWCLVRP